MLIHRIPYKSLNRANFGNSVTEKRRPEEDRSGLAEGEEIFTKNRGGSGISTYS
jgi:hypothetical protein